MSSTLLESPMAGLLSHLSIPRMRQSKVSGAVVLGTFWSSSLSAKLSWVESMSPVI